MSARTNRIKIAVTSGVALMAAATIATLSAQGQEPRTLEFSSPPPSARDDKEIDVRPRGTSIGDQSIGAISLRSGGRLVGRLMAVCTANDRSFEGRQCVITLVLRDGQLTAHGGGLDRRIPGAPGHGHQGDSFAVTGGTGAYEGASGALTLRETRGGRTEVTVTLR